jgi:hypothetical protein
MSPTPNPVMRGKGRVRLPFGTDLTREGKVEVRDLDALAQGLVTMFSVKRGIGRGEHIMTIGNSSTIFDYVAARLGVPVQIIENGSRRIFTFQYPGDFCDGHSYILRPPRQRGQRADECSVGIILHKHIERIAAKFPILGLAFWRETMIEASIFRESNVGHRLRPNASHICSASKPFGLKP